MAASPAGVDRAPNDCTETSQLKTGKAFFQGIHFKGISENENKLAF